VRSKTVRGIEVYYVEEKDHNPLSGRRDDLILFSKEHNSSIYIKPPQLSKESEYFYSDNSFLERARRIAKEKSLNPDYPNASVIVYEDLILGEAANGSLYHKLHGCERVKKDVPSGYGYELCEGCHPKNHSEPKAIKQALENGYETLLADATLYLYGHCWSCSACNNTMGQTGIRHVVFSETWTKKFLDI